MEVPPHADGNLVELGRGDLKPAHVLHDTATGQLTGVLDWGDVSLGDRVLDHGDPAAARQAVDRLREHLHDD